MNTFHGRPSRKIANLDSRFHFGLLVCLVVAVTYFAPIAQHKLIPVPPTIWPMWPNHALLVCVLLVVPYRSWPIIIAAGFAGFILYDLHAGVHLRAIAWFTAADTVQVLGAALCLTSFFPDGVPRLNSVKELAKYSFAATLAPFAAAFLSAPGIEGNYWTGWRVAFLSDVLAFFTLAPAILGLVSNGPEWARKPRSFHLEAAALMAGLVSFGYIIFVVSNENRPPALLFFIVPFLLWAASRFGTTGVSTSMIVVTFLSIYGAIRGRGPLIGPGPSYDVLWLQLFLLFTSIPFMLLAALAEERKRAEAELRKSEERLNLAVQAGRMYAFEWDAATDALVRSGQCRDVLNWLDDPTHDTGRQFVTRVHPEDREAYAKPESGLSPDNPKYQTRYRVLRPDGCAIWLEANGRALFDGQGKLTGIIGLVADVTERRLVEDAIAKINGKLIQAQEEERARIARELHDDICQRIALLAVQLNDLENRHPASLGQLQLELGQASKAAQDLGSDVQDLSHRLHSSKLEHLGLAAAAAGFCREFSDQCDVNIDFQAGDIPNELPGDISICLFRVLQEAVQNSAKHSGARHIRVSLRNESNQIELTVHDSGIGFDPEMASRKSGLGLTSMRERMKLVNGELSIKSGMQRGTTVRARVPYESLKKSFKAG